MKQILSTYERVMLARSTERPSITDYVNALFTDFVELKGDRIGKEDGAIYGGIGFYKDIPVTVIGHRKGKSLEENLKFNFGMPHPEGYRKALRLMKQAEKFRRPIITFIDTPGAYPGKDAEENGQSVAIAECMAHMSRMKTPILAIVTGEGSSGGALAIGVANEIWMLENSVYSILSPEGFASILWKDSSRSKEACDVMRMTAQDLLEDGFIDGIISEPDGGIQKNYQEGFDNIKYVLNTQLKKLMSLSDDNLANMRYEKFRNIDKTAYRAGKDC